jgi:hypothetical protein
MFLNSLLPLYFLSMCLCSVTLWQLTVFYSVLCPLSQYTQHPQAKELKRSSTIILWLTLVLQSVLYLVTVHGATYNKLNIVQKELWYLGWVQELLSTFCVATCLHFLNSFSSPAALFCSSLQFRRHFKHYLKCCYQHEKQNYDFQTPNNNLRKLQLFSFSPHTLQLPVH